MAKRLKDKYGNIPMKDIYMRPWHTVCVNCIGSFTIKIKDSQKKIRKQTIRGLMLIDPATCWFEMGHMPDEDFNSQRKSQLMNQL